MPKGNRTNHPKKANPKSSPARLKAQAKYNKKAGESERRVENNKANRKHGTYGNGDGKDIAHSKPNAKGKTKIQSASANRSFARTKTARRKSK